MESTARLVWQNLWALATIHLLCDSAVFLLHRMSHRLTNEGTRALLGLAFLPRATLTSRSLEQPQCHGI